MKEKIGNFTFCLFCFICIFFIFKNNKEVAQVIIDATNLFLTKVFVSLFPMFILNDILINANIPYYFYILCNRFFLKVFHTSGLGAYVFFMSLISGSPSNAYILKELVEKEKLTEKEASHLLTFTYFSNPLFLTMMLSSMFTMKETIKIILIHYLANVIIGILIRKKAPQISKNNQKLKESNQKNTLTKSINKAITTLLMILGTVTFYMLITYILTTLLGNNVLLKTGISGFLEITNGLNNLAMLNISTKLKEVIAIAIISFGGLSIHTQIKAILEDTKICYRFFLKGRIMHACIGILLIMIF